MSTTEIDSPLFESLQEIAAKTDFAGTLEHLTAPQQRTLLLFLSALACKSEDEYLSLSEASMAYQELGGDFKERLALVWRAFCVGHEWVSHNWILWNK